MVGIGEQLGTQTRVQNPSLLTAGWLTSAAQGKESTLVTSGKERPGGREMQSGGIGIKEESEVLN